MKFVPGSHKRGRLAHVTLGGSNSLNNAAQGINETHADHETVHAPLRPGQFSLHNTNVIHASDPNRGDDRRIGVGISYIPAHCEKSGLRMTATLVRGSDRYGHFDCEPDPRMLTAEKAAEAHEHAYARYRASYEEQIRMLNSDGSASHE